MSDQYIGEIRYFTYVRGAPTGWLACDGSSQSIATYPTLFQLLGTAYGGDGVSTFNLPDLRGRVPIGVDHFTPRGQQSGTETVTLTNQHLPQHTHMISASASTATSGDPTGRAFATGSNGVALYVVPTTPSPTAMAGTMVGAAGKGMPHDNCAPTMAILACIATTGLYPQPDN